jgi:hypothetical protein
MLAAARRVLWGLSTTLPAKSGLVYGHAPQQSNGYDRGAFAIHCAQDVSRQLQAAAGGVSPRLALPVAVADDGSSASIGPSQRARLAAIMRNLAGL